MLLKSKSLDPPEATLVKICFSHLHLDGKKTFLDFNVENYRVLILSPLHSRHKYTLILPPLIAFCIDDAYLE